MYDPVTEREVGQYPNVRREFFPTICNQCHKPPCVSVCPVKATWRRPEDGIVVIDYDRCIGCRYCLTACPYQMRAFDYGEHYNLEPRMDWYDGAKSPEYNEQRVRGGTYTSPIGNARKCTFCLHRVKEGLKPACVEACLGHARYFGNLADPNDELWELISRNGHMRLKEELGTEPSVYYLL
jgi:molybdopterin-containing oxidoreductase family iron-sulfur binding subunit